MQVNPKVNWKLKSRRIFEIAVVISLSVHIAIFLSFREFKSQEILVDSSSKILNVEDIPETEQFDRPPPPAVPAVPVESLDENLLYDITIEDGGFSVPEEILRIVKGDVVRFESNGSARARSDGKFGSWKCGGQSSALFFLPCCNS